MSTARGSARAAAFWCPAHRRLALPAGPLERKPDFLCNLEPDMAAVGRPPMIDLV